MLGSKRVGAYFLVLFLSVVCTGCDPWFSYSPYGSRLHGDYHDITAENLKAIANLNEGDSKPFKVALIADTHYHFGKLADAIADINRRGDFDFAIVVGDITDNGLKQEFIFLHESMKALTIPYFTVIGNHDYLANGEQVYTQMYGEYNYAFEYNNVKLVMFDNVRWESEKVPDFGWLDAELENREGYDHIIPFSHIPPFDGQMDEFREEFHRILLKHHIGLSIHGHAHRFSLDELYGDDILYHTVSTPQHREYTSLTVLPDTLLIENVPY